MENLPARVAGAGPLADYQIGMRVNTREGYPGVITDILEGPADLTTYWVRLDNDMGGGEYAEAEIWPLAAQQTASAMASEAGVDHTAADDYPELDEILAERLPPAITTTAAGKEKAPECTCLCEVCMEEGSHCTCPDGPTIVTPSGSCEVHGYLTDTTAAAEWQKAEHGYVHSSGEFYLERQARMSSGGTNGWAIHRKTPADKIGLDNGGPYHVDTGDSLLTVNGVHYHHVGDEGSLADAKYSVENHHKQADYKGTPVSGTCKVCGKKIVLERGSLTHADGSNDHAVVPSDDSNAPIGVSASAEGLCPGTGHQTWDIGPMGPITSAPCDTCGHVVEVKQWGGGNASFAAHYPDGRAEDGAHEAAARLALYLPPKPPSEQRASTTPLAPSEKQGYDEGFSQGKEGLTREPSLPGDPEYMAGFDIGWAEGVQVQRTPPDSFADTELEKAQIAGTYPDQLGPMRGSADTSMLDHLRQMEAHGAPVDLGMPQVHEAGAILDWISGNPRPNDSWHGVGTTHSHDWCRFRRDSHCWLSKDLNEEASKQAGYAVWNPVDRGYCFRVKWADQQKCPVGAPGPNVSGGFTDATVPWDQGGQRGGVPTNMPDLGGDPVTGALHEAAEGDITISEVDISGASTTRCVAAFVEEGGYQSPIGVLTWDPETDNVEVVYVDSEFRSKRLATRMLDEAKRIVGHPLGAHGEFTDAGVEWATRKGLNPEVYSKISDVEMKAVGSRLLVYISRTHRQSSLTDTVPEVSGIVREYAMTPTGNDFFASEADDISRAYRDMPVLDLQAAVLWAELGELCVRQAEMLGARYQIIRLDDRDPYATAAEMYADIDRGVYKVTSLHSHHPVWDVDTNVAFRVVHDLTGHATSRSDFSLKGEVLAYQNQCAQTPEYLWPVLFTEIVAQSAYANVHHLFGEQKVGFLGLTQAEIDAHVGKVMDAPDEAYDALHRSAGLKPGDIGVNGVMHTAAFEVTATWADVRRKAKRIREAGGVRVVAATSDEVVAHIKGDHGIYETHLRRNPGRRNVAYWHCGCLWSAFAWGRSPAYKRFEGRMCSHALALQYEAQARTIFGRPMTLDEKQPAWMDQAHVHRPGDYRRDLKRYTSLHEMHPVDSTYDLDDDPAEDLSPVAALLKEAAQAVCPICGDVMTSQVAGMSCMRCGTLIPFVSTENLFVTFDENQPVMERAGDMLKQRYAEYYTEADMIAAWLASPEAQAGMSAQEALNAIYHEQEPDLFSRLLTTASASEFFARVKGIVRKVVLGPDGPKVDGKSVAPFEVLYPKWHPSKGLQVNDNSPVIASKKAGESIADDLRYEWISLVGMKDEFGDDEYATQRMVATLNGVEVGHIDFDGDEQHVLVIQMVTKPEYRRQGIGTRMLARLKSRYDDAIFEVEDFIGHGEETWNKVFGHQVSAKKDKGPKVSGVALVAADTGRVLMLQRSMEDKKDPARGTWEFPGGHHEEGDQTSLHAGIREWEEEVGQPFPEGGYVAHTWRSPNGIYQGHVVVIPEEAGVVLHQGRIKENPDDPDSKYCEQVAWWGVEHAKKNPALREECKATPWKELVKVVQQKAASLTKTADEDQCPNCGEDWPGTVDHGGGWYGCPACGISFTGPGDNVTTVPFGQIPEVSYDHPRYPSFAPAHGGL